MSKKKKIKWLPVVSFACLLFLLFSVGSMINFKVGASLVGAVIMIITTFSSLLTPHYEDMRDRWFEKILPESHYVIIWLTALVGIVFLFMLNKQFRISFKIEKNG